MIGWLKTNYHWLFSGAGVTIIVLILRFPGDLLQCQTGGFKPELLQLINIAKRIEGQNQKDNQFAKIVKIAVDQNAFKEAEHTAGLISDPKIKDESFEIIFQQAIKTDKIELAYKIANIRISDKTNNRQSGKEDCTILHFLI